MFTLSISKMKSKREIGYVALSLLLARLLDRLILDLLDFKNQAINFTGNVVSAVTEIHIGRKSSKKEEKRLNQGWTTDAFSSVLAPIPCTCTCLRTCELLLFCIFFLSCVCFIEKPLFPGFSGRTDGRTGGHTLC